MSRPRDEDDEPEGDDDGEGRRKLPPITAEVLDRAREFKRKRRKPGPRKPLTRQTKVFF